jgi:hypothetical protein
MTEPTTAQTDEARINEATARWMRDSCPKGLIDPITGFLDEVSRHKIRAYLLGVPEEEFRQHIDDLTIFYVRAVDELWETLVWFGPMPPKPPQPKRTPKPPPPEPERPLGPWDRQRLQSEQDAENAQRQERMKKLADEALKKQQATEADPFPSPVYKNGRVDHRATSELRAKWLKRHPEAAKKANEGPSAIVYKGENELRAAWRKRSGKT